MIEQGPEPIAPHGDPTARVEAAYRAAARRMAGVPILNDRLAVAAEGFRRWNGQWLGALVTPWCINVVLLPDAPDRWPGLRAGDKRVVRLPAGDYEFVAGHDPILGEHHSLSLFSPVLEFENQEAACLTARAALLALFDAAHYEAHEAATAAQAVDAAGSAAAARRPLAELRASVEAPLSKREFLRGGFSPVKSPARRHRLHEP